MPYDSNADLPSYVKKLPEKKQSQWRHVFNSCMSDGGDEGKCFRAANGVVKKEVTDFELPVEGDAAEFDVGEPVVLAEKSYQYVDAYEYESRKLSQQDAAYNPVGGTGSKACSNCMFFISPARCSIVAGEIAPNGKSNQWRAVPTYEPKPLEVVVVGTIKSGAFKENKAPNAFIKAAQSIATLVGVKPKQPPEREGLFITKQADGRLRWFARYSNAWEDRDKEIVTEAAHKEYIEWAYETKAFPELWLWHTPGTRFGEADWLDFSDGFAHASGLIDEGKESVINYLAGKELGVSHGFMSLQNGKYIEKYRTFEISVLPLDRAAVWTTDFNFIAKESEMTAFTPERRTWLVEALGEDAVKELEGNTSNAANQLKQLGVEYKQVAATEEAQKAEAQKAEGEGLKALSQQIAELTGIVNGLTGAVVTLKKDVDAAKASATEAQKSADEKTEDVFLGKLAAALKAGGITRPTESAGNLTKEKAPDAEQAQSSSDFLGTMVLKQLAAVGQNGAGVGTPAAAAVTVQE